MNSKVLEFFNDHPNLPLKNIFFTALRKLTANDKNQEIFSTEIFFVNFESFLFYKNVFLIIGQIYTLV